MNDYGFVSSTRIKNTAAMLTDEKLGVKATAKSLDGVSGVNPIIINNEKAFDLLMQDPAKFDNTYSVSPLSPRRKSEIDSKPLSEMNNAPIGDVLYKTRDATRLRLNGDPGYAEYVKKQELRGIATGQISQASSKIELQKLMDSNMQPDMNHEFGIDTPYTFPALSPRLKAEIDSTSIKEMVNAPISHVLYKTMESSEIIRIPGDPSYEEWELSNILRNASVDQMNTTNSDAEARLMMSERLDKANIDVARCETLGGLTQDDQGKWTPSDQLCLSKVKENTSEPSLSF
ncbi:hypothetical protein LMH73_017510 [Vibrio splendidus]|nr:hypothetical protein [Vibrio splendidus]MCC4880334.1 hypothetical protein [Vibrio splendidus]